MITSIATAETLQLDAAISAVYGDWVGGRIGEIVAHHRISLLETQRAALTPPTKPIGRPLRAALPVNKFTLRRCQRSADREAARTRRRTWSADGRMPPGMRGHYTEGEKAALTIIALEIKRHGYCDLHVGAIANKGGVCRTTAQNAMREAVRLGHISKEERPSLAAKAIRTSCGSFAPLGWAG
jgi:hypothetical protein